MQQCECLLFRFVYIQYDSIHKQQMIPFFYIEAAAAARPPPFTITMSKLK